MIEISFGKLLVLALIALIVLGPEKLPAAARTAGALVRRLRGSWDSVRAEVERELQVDEIRRTAREAAARVDAAQADLDSTLQHVREAAASAGDSVAPTVVVAPDGAATEANPKLAATAADAEVQPAPTADTATDAAGQLVDTRTGDLFDGTFASAPAAAPIPTEPPHGTD